MKSSTFALVLGQLGALAAAEDCGTITSIVTVWGSAVPFQSSFTTATAPPSSIIASATSTSATVNKPSSTSTSLDKLYKENGKLYFGNVADANTFSNQAATNILKRDYGQVTPENSLKWDATEPQKGQFSFTNSDKLVQFAQQNNMSVRGHTLVWYQQLPDWVKSITDKATLTSVLENHISTVVGRYKGKIRAWDVVNEIFNEDGTLRESVFSKVLGEDFVKIAFNAARAADPDAKLYINDFNLDVATYSKVTAMVDKVNEWIAAGIPIDGIGSQSHLNHADSRPISGVQAAIEKLASSDVSEVALTELDIANGTADDWLTITNACLAVRKCVGITAWGISDATSWLPDSAATMFDKSNQAKDSYTAVIKALQA